MQRRDHHDWTSDAYVEEWVTRQRAEDGTRAERFRLMCDLLPFTDDAKVTVLDVGAGYGPVSQFILDRYPNATCIAQDGSEPMLEQARRLMARYGARFKTHLSDLFDTNWLPRQFGPFSAAVSSSCLHNLRDFERIGEIYRQIHDHLQCGGVFLNLDLVNAPTLGVQRHYARVAAARRQRTGAPAATVEALVRGTEYVGAEAPAQPFPANLDEQLAALRAAGFTDVDCFWKDLRRALVGGYVTAVRQQS
jgi:tRNA (cmo5U34)-methyltransferase